MLYQVFISRLQWLVIHPAEQYFQILTQPGLMILFNEHVPATDIDIVFEVQDYGLTCNSFFHVLQICFDAAEPALKASGQNKNFITYPVCSAYYFSCITPIVMQFFGL